jgi:hypothetical protein
VRRVGRRGGGGQSPTANDLTIYGILGHAGAVDEEHQPFERAADAVAFGQLADLQDLLDHQPPAGIAAYNGHPDLAALLGGHA